MSEAFAGGGGKDKGPKAPKGYESVSLGDVNVGDYVTVRIVLPYVVGLGRSETLVYSGMVLSTKNKNGEPVGCTIKMEVGGEEKDIMKEGAWANARFVIVRRKVQRGKRLI